MTTGPVDHEAVATAHVLEIPISTDDSDMIKLAAEYEVSVIKVLELMKLMLDTKHITVSKVKAIVTEWKYLNDLPKNFEADYRRIYKEKSPNID